MDSAALTSARERNRRDQPGNACPLILDIDEILLQSDFLIETALAYIKPNPLRVLNMLWWLVQSRTTHGRSDLMHQLALFAEPNFENLPVNEELVTLAEAAAKQGRPVYLATASDAPIARQLARHFSFLTGVISDGGKKLSGEATAAALARRFPNGFDYAGYARADLAVCRMARTAILVPMSHPPRLKASGTSAFTAWFKKTSELHELMRALRWRHWAKNLLVFVPILLAGRLADWSALSNTMLAFVAIGMIASATYLINDMLDLPDDRTHWSKRYRPLASGRLPIEIATIVAPLGIVLGILTGMMASGQVAEFLSLYLLVTLSYSFGLKRVPVVDGLVLAALFTIRLGIGIVAADVRPSPWLLAFSMFLFASLSYAKRYTEIERTVERNASPSRGRGYCVADAPLILVIGVSAGIGAVLILVFYIIEDAFAQTFYGNTIWLWGLPPLVFLLISRIWLKSRRGEMNDDPVEFVLTDRSSLAVAMLMTICFAFAWLGALRPW
jgi:4-hydroxybenzoate polyprenyltransferase